MAALLGNGVVNATRGGPCRIESAELRGNGYHVEADLTQQVQAKNMHNNTGEMYGAVDVLACVAGGNIGQSGHLHGVANLAGQG